MKRSRYGVFIVCAVMLPSCSPDATLIRKRGYIGETVHNDDEEISSQETRLERCLMRGTKRYSSAAAVAASSPMLDASTRELRGEFAFDIHGMPRQKQKELRQKHILWVYGQLVVARPNDALLKEIQRWTLRFAKQHPKEREAPVVQWTAEKTADTWRSNVFAVQFSHGIFQAVGLDQSETLNESPIPHFLPYTLSGIEDRASDITIPGEIPGVQLILPKFAGVFRFRATAIEFISGDKTFCLPANEP